MKFQPTINVYAGDIITRLIDGTLKLQCGQWIKCGTHGGSSRWCGVTNTGSLVAAHPDGLNGPVTNERFGQLMDYWRSRKA
jgi:hypothetical protein|tara:strand:- start:770 stop:1012 length:243 start_codon:yes stop_codon:yes gene_type:complete